ncbi:hypothetical protein D3C71_1886470 [compost metagenome]
MLLEKFTIRPPSFKRVAASRRVLKVPRVLMANVWSNSSSLCCARGITWRMPALLINTSTLPSCASVSSNIRRTSAAEDTSAFTAMAWWPAWRSCTTNLDASLALLA